MTPPPTTTAPARRGSSPACGLRVSIPRSYASSYASEEGIRRGAVETWMYGVPAHPWAGGGGRHHSIGGLHPPDRGKDSFIRGRFGSDKPKEVDTIPPKVHS